MSAQFTKTKYVTVNSSIQTKHGRKKRKASMKFRGKNIHLFFITRKLFQIWYTRHLINSTSSIYIKYGDWTHTCVFHESLRVKIKPTEQTKKQLIVPKRIRAEKAQSLRRLLLLLLLFLLLIFQRFFFTKSRTFTKNKRNKTRTH